MALTVKGGPLHSVGVGFPLGSSPAVTPGTRAPLSEWRTFQAEDPVPQRIDDVLQGRLIRHVEEVLVIGVTGDVFDFI